MSLFSQACDCSHLLTASAATTWCYFISSIITMCAIYFKYRGKTHVHVYMCTACIHLDVTLCMYVHVHVHVYMCTAYVHLDVTLCMYTYMYMYTHYRRHWGIPAHILPSWHCKPVWGSGLPQHSKECRNLWNSCWKIGMHLCDDLYLSQSTVVMHLVIWRPLPTKRQTCLWRKA